MRLPTLFLRFMSAGAPRPGSIEKIIQEKLTLLLEPATLTINNESWKHRHHIAMREGEWNGDTHFSVTIVSEKFKGKSNMQRHRMVYAALTDEFSKGLHALSLKTRTPEEAEGVSDTLAS